MANCCLKYSFEPPCDCNGNVYRFEIYDPVTKIVISHLTFPKESDVNEIGKIIFKAYKDAENSTKEKT
jgi:hypothetical protein